MRETTQKDRANRAAAHQTLPYAKARRGPSKKPSGARRRRVEVRLDDVEASILEVAAKGTKGGLAGFMRITALKAASVVYLRRSK